MEEEKMMKSSKEKLSTGSSMKHSHEVMPGLKIYVNTFLPLWVKRSTHHLQTSTVRKLLHIHNSTVLHPNIPILSTTLAVTPCHCFGVFFQTFCREVSCAANMCSILTVAINSSAQAELLEISNSWKINPAKQRNLVVNLTKCSRTFLRIKETQLHSLIKP